MAVNTGILEIGNDALYGDEIRKSPHNDNYSLLIDNDLDLQSQIVAKLDVTIFNRHYQGISNKHSSESITYDGTVPSVSNVRDAINSNRSLINTNYATLSNEIDNNYNDLNNKINTVDDRVDNIIAGSGTSSTEVVDARFDNNWAIAYATLSERIDSIQQFTDGVDTFKYRLASDGERLQIEIEEVI